MTLDAYAPSVDEKTLILARLVNHLAEDAIFAVAAGGTSCLESLAKRRGEAYSALLAGHRLNSMCGETDHWIVELTRAIAPIAPPEWMPMSEVLRERVTLEVGARGLRSLFSSKPSDKDVLRVKRLGTLSARVLRAVFASDGPPTPEEARTVAALVASFGLPEADAAPLYSEAPMQIEKLEVYGDLEPAFAKALVRGAWLAAAWDQLDPREEQAVRALAGKIAFPPEELEALRAEVLARVDARRGFGLAVVDAIRFVLSDRVPGHGVTLAAKTGALVLPPRYREEALAQVGHGAPVTLAKRHAELGADQRASVLAIAWAAALYEDPSVARRALLRARHDRVAQDLGEDGLRARAAVEEWMNDVLAPAAFPMGATP